MSMTGQIRAPSWDTDKPPSYRPVNQPIQALLSDWNPDYRRYITGVPDRKSSSAPQTQPTALEEPVKCEEGHNIRACQRCELRTFRFSVNNPNHKTTLSPLGYKSESTEHFHL
ncbi:hypothetical protein Bbelb_412960 [Branchiostoma belcheri]|nr:hypothetical protein Bbelb_412960 [Branchiostoma belcheri]